MSISFFLEKTNLEIAKFEKIGLDEMDSVKLMDRVDVKYLIPLHLLPIVLADAIPYYKILEINGKNVCLYETLYYDTDDFQLYHNHQAGKTNRYKVRFRNYVESNLAFFEIKYKNNKGRTIKTRIRQQEEATSVLAEEKALFLEKQTPLSSADLKGNIWVNYSRITLVSKTTKERLTIDLNLTFLNESGSKSYSEMAIAEVKQEKIGNSPIIEILKKYHIRSGSISKYCLGIISLYEGIKLNRFKSKLTHLHKIQNLYDAFTKDYTA